MIETHSISAGLDYPGVGPEHSYLKRRAAPSYVAADRRRRAGRPSSCSAGRRASSRRWSRSHAVAWVLEQGERQAFTPRRTVVVDLSGRGDKDINTVADALGVTL